MHEYLFYTGEGCCEAPNYEKVENFQVLGFEKGATASEAFDKLLENNPWILESEFDPEEILQVEAIR